MYVLRIDFLHEGGIDSLWENQAVGSWLKAEG